MRNFIVSVIIILNCLLSFSQNQHFVTQYMIHQPILNMAAIAANDHINVAGLHRQQWVGFEGAPKTSLFSINAPIKSTKLHIGGIVAYDQIGANAITNVDLGIAYRMKLSRNLFLSLALKGGMMNTAADYSELYLNTLNDPSFPETATNKIQPSFGFSTYLFSDNYYVGIAVPTFLNNTTFYDNEQRFTPKDFHYFLTGGYQFQLSKSFKLGVSTLLKGVIAAPLQADFNARLLYNDFIGLGLTYRTSNDLAAIFSIKAFNQLTISYSYDFGMSELSRHHSNTHEIMLVFDAPSRNLIPVTSPRF
ncbi:hypothetical protein CW751_13695 [Brumimicrobium salinarum]|uniref:Type IX secretion system membrane protein PorP/SprF n=1 Tax=Brumimicrobium salinarum TaxID=2058658 RepID=A0A2I0QZD7_9FLAO|nr:type IX secretion system membrane protein PorP/SprF [Brumimicrobium salinarum]PKR79688.1 hypothetical protein CW751_13695 [Brumimicrobium salinarum]